MRIAAAADIHASDVSADRVQRAFADLRGEADVVLLGVFVLGAKISGNGSTAWAVTQYFALTVIGLVLLLLLVGGVLELRDRRRNHRG